MKPKTKTPEKPKSVVRDSWEIKHRPKTLDDVYGQPGAVAYLKDLFDKNEMPSAIMFIGGSGQGKTTLARVVAATINGRTCDDWAPEDDDKTIRDYYEHDFGEKSTKDEVRGLIQRSKMLPSQRGALNIVLIDEFHSGATKLSYNPLLKTLEQPPRTTMFLMATDQPERLPPAILGRCKKVILKPSDVADTGRLLLSVARKEKVLDLFESKAQVRRIADLCGGQPRDSLQSLQTISGTMRSGGTYDEALKAMLSATGEGDLVKGTLEILLGMYTKSPKRVLLGMSQIDSFHGMVAKALEINKYWLELSYGGSPYRGFDRVKLISMCQKKQVDPAKNVRLAIEASARLVRLRERMNNYLVSEHALATSILLHEDI